MKYYYTLKAKVSTALAEEIEKQRKDLGISLAEFVRDGLTLWLLMLSKIDEGYEIIFRAPDGKEKNITETISDAFSEPFRGNGNESLDDNA